MKKWTFLILLLIAAMLAGTVTAFAVAEYSEDYYRATSTTGNLSDAERDSLDEDYIEFMQEYGLDFAGLCTTAEYYGEDSLEDFAKAYYLDCGFGYGEKQSGIMFLYDPETGEHALVLFGEAEERIPDSVPELIRRNIKDFYEKYGEWGALYGAFGFCRDEFKDQAENSDKAAPPLQTIAPDETPVIATVSADSGLPEWYPADISQFQFFHNENAPRVIDKADVLTDAEEAALAAQIQELCAKTQHDLVIVTDVTDYGLGKTGFADDFYDYNGYGIGAEREGACIFIDMDPNNRGWWTSCCGSDTMSLYTEAIANEIDDDLYNYMAAGRDYYAQGLSRWVDNMSCMFEKGFPFAPEWYPARGEASNRTHDASAPRVVDESGVLTEAQLQDLEAKASAISDQYGLDVVIHFANRPTGMYGYDYADAFYRYLGYGLGNDYAGIQLTVFTNLYGSCYITSEGESVQLTQVNKERMEEKAEVKTENDAYYDGALVWLKDLAHMERTGLVQKPLKAWIGYIFAGLAGGGIFGGVSTGNGTKKMKVPQLSYGAENYLVEDSVQIIKLYDNYLGTETTRTYNPPVESSSSSGGGGGGHSSYSGGHSSSSGSSHSGSGRSF